MKYPFSENSLQKLETCHYDLQLIFKAVALSVDCSIICGHRDEEAQNEAFANHKSKLKFPQSNHNKMPSMAVDAMPYPIDWSDLPRLYYFGGIVKATAQQLYQTQSISHLIRWGGDWDNDNSFTDNLFNDLGHFELRKPNDSDN